jgi:uncharacterized membrane protein
MFKWLFKNRPILNAVSQQKVVQCIKDAEAKTTGEIRVYVEHECKHGDAIDRAKEIFAELGMHKTEKRNAVIVYLAINSRKFAIFGDVEIYHKAGGAHFWQAAAQKMKTHLKDNDVTNALCTGVNELGLALATHFPYDPAVNKNELPDEIVFGK